MNLERKYPIISNIVLVINLGTIEYSEIPLTWHKYKAEGYTNISKTNIDAKAIIIDIIVLGILFFALIKKNNIGINKNKIDKVLNISLTSHNSASIPVKKKITIINLSHDLLLSIVTIPSSLNNTTRINAENIPPKNNSI
jgi:hypothetical protein